MKGAIGTVADTEKALLAVDLGVRCGLAHYSAEGRLLSYRSHNFGSASRMRRGIPGIVREIGPPSHLLLEGGGDLAEPWIKEATRLDIAVISVTADHWRKSLLLPRERNGTAVAKQQADGLARFVIEWSGASRPTSLRHDAAEAILAGFWGVHELGWSGLLYRKVDL